MGMANLPEDEGPKDRVIVRQKTEPHFKLPDKKIPAQQKSLPPFPRKSTTSDPLDSCTAQDRRRDKKANRKVAIIEEEEEENSQEELLSILTNRGRNCLLTGMKSTMLGGVRSLCCELSFTGGTSNAAMH